MKQIALIANGPINNLKEVSKRLSQYDSIIAVDGGLNTCHSMGIVPDLIIGDMDSVSPTILDKFPEIPKKIFPPEKDKTDLELAIEEVLPLEPEKITLFGALRNRTDHSLYNLHLLRRHPILLEIETENETMVVITNERTFSCQSGQTVSLIPIGGPVHGVTTKGLKWELHNATLDQDFMSISNVCLQDKFYVSITQGDLLCCLMK